MFTRSHRWQLVDRFHEALALRPAERAAFLAGIADADVRAELASLLRASDSVPSTFLEKPAQRAAARVGGAIIARRLRREL